MVVYFGGLKRAKEMYYGGHKIKEAWYGGKLVYTSHNPIKGFEAFFDLLDRDGYRFETGLPDTRVSIGSSESSYRNSHLHVVCGDEASVLIEQVDDGRRALDLTVSEGKVTVKSTGDRGKNNLDFSGDWPGGEHVLSVSVSSDWYGYSINVLVDGVSIGSQSNGGAFALSENFITSGGLRFTLKGCSARQQLYFSSLPYDRRDEIKAAIQHGVTWRVLTEPWSGEFAVPGGQFEAWIYSGGNGGQGGSTSYSGRSGADGAGRYVGPVAQADLATLIPGAGGSGGRWNSVGSGSYGSSGSASTIRVFDGRTIDSSGGGRPTPTIRDVEFQGSLPGKGGKGGSSSDSGGSHGSSGGKGGLVVARYW